MSWGGREFSGETSYDHIFNVSGVTFTAASGDNGSGVLWPAACPNVLAVGGTTLKLTAQGTVISEVAWKGSGGGASAFEKRPAYQNGWNTKTGRGTPDVSYNADPAKGGTNNVPQDQWKEGIFSGTHGSYWDKDGNLYVQDWNVSGRIMKLVRVK